MRSAITPTPGRRQRSHGLNKDLGFTDADQVENIRRISSIGLLADAGLIVLVSFISPFRDEREMAEPAGSGRVCGDLYRYPAQYL